MFTYGGKYWNCLAYFHKLFFILLLFLANSQISHAQIAGDSPIFPTDVELEISTPNAAVGQWKKLPVTVTISNTGDEAAENIVVRIGTCVGHPGKVTFDTQAGGIVYTSTPYESTSGTFSQFGGSWIIPRVAGSTSESITLEYFTLTNDPIKLFAFVEKMDSEDIDSSPQSNVFNLSCEVTEDDEALLTINPGVTPFDCEGDVVLTTQKEVDDFGNTCFEAPFGRAYYGSIKIEGSDINNLDALADLRFIEGDFSLINTSVENLSQVLQIGATLGGKFVATGNDNLGQINLGSIIAFSEDAIKIIDNQRLTNITLPFSPVSIKSLTVSNNSSLELIDFNGIKQIGEVLTIYLNPKLKGLHSFTSLATVGGAVVISTNNSLTSLKGLENLTSINSQSIGDAGGYGLVINNNQNLSQCCEVLDLLLSTTAINKGYNIVGNDSGCSSFEEIRTNCGPITTCDLLTTIDIDFCSDPSVDLVATYRYQGKLYLGTTGSGLDSFTDVVDCETGALLCTYSPIPLQELSSCPDFFQESELIQVISRRSECPGCGCGDIDPYTGIPYEEVCGSDGKTYPSECAANCAGVTWTYGPCDDGGVVTCGEITIIPVESSLTIRGASGKDYFFKVFRTAPRWEYVFECTNNCGPAVFVDNLSAGTYFVDVYDSNWKLICDDIEVAVTEEENCFCTQEVDPVCGVDGKTYSNSCVAACAGVELAYDGPCEECICTQEVDPVCGVDGKGYGNRCLAACAGVEVAYDGPCVIDPPYSCAAIDYENLDPCDPLLKELALYEYKGEIYVVFVPEFDINFQDLETTATNCSTGELKCAQALLLGAYPDVIPCFEFFEEATKLEVIVSKEDCEDCNCPIPGPLEIFNVVCGSDGKTYNTPCDAECAGVTWTDGPCEEGGITCGEITVIPGIDRLTIRGSAGKNYFFKVHRTSPKWESVFQCNADCGSEVTIDNLPSGTYYVDVYDSNWTLICDDIEVDLIAIGNTEKTDLELSITTTNPFPAPGEPFEVYLKIKNNSTVKATDIEVSTFNYCDGDTPFSGLLLKTRAVGPANGIIGEDGIWKLRELAPNAATTLTYSFELLLDDVTFSLRAGIIKAFPEDIDSTPSLEDPEGTNFCTAEEDDEAIFTFRPRKLPTFCDLLEVDPCDPAIKEQATYTYAGRTYLLTTPSNSDAELIVRDCETGEIFCIITNNFVNVRICPNFLTQDATLLKVLSSREDCPDCGCPAIDPLPSGPFEVCGSDGIRYATACDAECAGVEIVPCDQGGITCGEITVIPDKDQITIRGTAGKNYFFKVHRTFPKWEYVFQCNADCGSEVTIDNLPLGPYFLDVYNSSWKLICDDIEVGLVDIDDIQETGATSRNKSSGLNSVNTTTANSLVVYPNPAQNSVHIQMDIDRNSTAQVYISNHLGQLIKELPFTQIDQQTISLESFPNGVYQVNVMVDDQLVAKEKLVVVK